MSVPTMTADEALVRSSWPRVTPLDSVAYLRRHLQTSTTVVPGRSEHAGHALPPSGVPGDRPATKDADRAAGAVGVVPIGMSDGRREE